MHGPAAAGQDPPGDGRWPAAVAEAPAHDEARKPSAAVKRSSSTGASPAAKAHKPAASSSPGRGTEPAAAAAGAAGVGGSEAMPGELVEPAAAQTEQQQPEARRQRQRQPPVRLRDEPANARQRGRRGRGGVLWGRHRTGMHAQFPTDSDGSRKSSDDDGDGGGDAAVDDNDDENSVSDSYDDDDDDYGEEDDRDRAGDRGAAVRLTADPAIARLAASVAAVAKRHGSGLLAAKALNPSSSAVQDEALLLVLLPPGQRPRVAPLPLFMQVPFLRANGFLSGPCLDGQPDCDATTAAAPAAAAAAAGRGRQRGPAGLAALAARAAARKASAAAKAPAAGAGSSLVVLPGARLALRAPQSQAVNELWAELGLKSSLHLYQSGGSRQPFSRLLPATRDKEQVLQQLQQPPPELPVASLASGAALFGAQPAAEVVWEGRLTPQRLWAEHLLVLGVVERELQQAGHAAAGQLLRRVNAVFAARPCAWCRRRRPLPGGWACQACCESCREAAADAAAVDAAAAGTGLVSQAPVGPGRPPANSVTRTVPTVPAAAWQLLWELLLLYSAARDAAAADAQAAVAAAAEANADVSQASWAAAAARGPPLWRLPERTGSAARGRLQLEHQLNLAVLLHCFSGRADVKAVVRRAITGSFWRSCSRCRDASALLGTWFCQQCLRTWGSEVCVPAAPAWRAADGNGRGVDPQYVPSRPAARQPPAQPAPPSAYVPPRLVALAASGPA